MQAGRPKVAIVGKLPPPYFGPAVATKIILESRLKERFELISVDTNVHEDIRTIGRWRFATALRHLGVYASFARCLRRHQPDLVLIPVSQTTIGFLKDSALILLSRLFRRTTILQLRGGNFRDWLDGVQPIMRMYVRRVLRSTVGVIVLGENLKYLFEGLFPSDRIYVVPNGANYSFPERRDIEPETCVKLLYLANLQPSKGIEDLMEAVSILVKGGTRGFQLDVVGAWYDSGTQKACEQLVEREGLPVTFRGPLYGAEKFACFADADAFVFVPREPEGHPWVIVEAMAAGLPIVATNRGAIPDCVRSGINGFLLEPSRPVEVARALDVLICDGQMREAMGSASREMYSNNFTEDAMVRRLGIVFDQALVT